MARKKPEKIQLTKQEEEAAIALLTEYFSENLQYEMGNLACYIFLDFISENIGRLYYNKAIEDAMAYMTERAEDMFLLMKENS